MPPKYYLPELTPNLLARLKFRFIEKRAPYSWCNRMFEQLYILQDGRMLMCCADWEQTGVMGNAATTPLRDIWNGDSYRHYRANFLKGDVKGTICDGCTKDAAGEEYEGWEEEWPTSGSAKAQD
jgi:hypothetical protein